MKAKTVRITVSHFEFSVAKDEPVESHDTSLTFSNVATPDLKISDGEEAIAATTTFSYASNHFNAVGTITGIFIIPSDFAEAAKLGNNDKIEMVRETTSKVIPKMMTKFQMYVALFSTEINASPVIPEFRIDTKDLTMVKKKSDK